MALSNKGNNIMVLHFVQDNWKILTGSTAGFLVGFRYVFHIGRRVGTIETKVTHLDEGQTRIERNQEKLEALLLQVIQK